MAQYATLAGSGLGATDGMNSHRPAPSAITAATNWWQDYEAARALNADISCGLEPGSGEGTTAETQFFLFVCGTLVFFMQCGFAMLSAGSVGSTSVVNIIFKNVCDAMLGAAVWWAVGYAFAFGDSDAGELIGNKHFFMTDLNSCGFAFWFYQWTFAATATTIVSGSVAGRTRLGAYLTYATFLTGFVYPCVVHWTWSNNAWLTKGDGEGAGYYDFAGSGIVHVVGGTAGLVGAVVVGPRGTSVFENYVKKNEIPGHSMPLVALGTLILMFGFFGFNGGSVLSMESPSDAAGMGRAVVVTVLAASGGSISALIVTQKTSKYWSLMTACNGALAGMVSICAGANVFEPWAGFVIGFIGGLVYSAWSVALHAMKVDDPLDAAPVHMGCGIWGVIAAPLFASVGMEGIFADGSELAFKVLGWNIAGVITIVVWTVATTYPMFKMLAKFDMLRVADETINQGLDFVEHGEMAYVIDHRAIKKGDYRSTMGLSKETDLTFLDVDDKPAEQVTTI